MGNRKAFVFYKEWKEAIKDLPDDIRLEIYESIIEYATTGDIQGLKPMAKVAFNFIKADIDRDIEKYMSMAERNKNNGHKGGRPKTSNNPKNPLGFSRTQNNPDKPKKAVEVEVEEEVEEEVEDKEEDYISPLSPDGDISPGKTVSDDLENEIPDNPPKPPEGEKEKSCAKKEKESKHEYGEYKNVLLTDSEYLKLKDNHDADGIINHFSQLKEMKGYKYKSDYLAIIKWGIQSYEEYKQRNGNNTTKQRRNPDYTESDFD